MESHGAMMVQPDHREKTAKTAALILAAGLLLAAQPFPVQAFESGLGPITESRAYEQYTRRPASTLSRLIYLIDRFKEADIQILYDDVHYPAPLAGTFARWFLSVRYSGETEEQWILRYCDKSIFTGEKIYARDSGGEYAEGSKVLFEELEKLNELEGKNRKSEV